MSVAAQVGLFAGGAVLGGSVAYFAQRSSAKPSAVPAATVPAGPAAPVPAPAAAPVAAPTAAPTAAAVAPVSDALALSGNPGPVDQLLRHQGYVSSYDRRLRHPNWTAEHLTAASIQRKPGPDGANRANSFFSEDMRIPELFRSTNAAYFRSGYDRGHMVPAADVKSSQAAMNETFLLSNIAPQVGAGMNRDYWAHTEDFVRRLTSKFDDLYVFTIPLYLPRQTSDGKWRVSYEVIGSPPSVSVPTHFAKVILGTGLKASEGSLIAKAGLGGAPMALGAFVVPNSMIPDSAPLRSFETDGTLRGVLTQSKVWSAPPALRSSRRRSSRRPKSCVIQSSARSSCATFPMRTSSSQIGVSETTRASWVQRRGVCSAT
ncbi:nuclease [Malassezia furfur]|uniref:Endonuclease n=1 Tax=Malassezia furfur TaxID=55194 RepID=A0ABY8EUU1_MALFU|nr:nuclease [Malassezia furfur]